MKHSLFFRNYIIMVVLSVSLLFLSGLALFITMRNQMLEAQRETLAREVSEAVRLANTQIQDVDPPLSAQSDLRALGEALRPVRVIADVHVLLATPEGELLLTSEPSDTGRHWLSASIVEGIRQRGRVSGQDDMGLFGTPRLYAGEGLYQGDTQIGLIVLERDGSARDKEAEHLLRLYVLMGAAVLLAAVLIGFSLSQRLNRPIANMSAAADRLARGDFSSRVPIEYKDTEIGTLAQSLNTMADALQHQESMRVDFIQNISHEFKTPMTTVTGYITGLLDGVVPPERERAIWETIQHEVMRMSRLLSRMLEITRLQSGGVVYRPRPIRICDMILTILSALETKIEGRGLAVNAQFPDRPSEVHADQDAIHQVLYNLVENAVKHGRDTLCVTVTEKSGRCQIVIENNGDTIPESELQFLFDRFHKVDKARTADRDGFGLGLHIVRSILHAHGEAITVESTGGITRFSFGLPLTSGINSHGRT